MRVQETRIYQRSLELVEVVQQAVQNLPVGYAYLADQLRRAAASVVLNYAEGYGKPTRAEQRRFLGIAKGSANEVRAALDVGQRLGAIAPALHERAVDIADHVAAMLTRFAQKR